MSFRTIAFLGLTSLIALSPVAGAAASKKADCLLVVDGFEAIRGTCKFETIDEDGSFQITGLNGKYFAYVMVTSEGVADGYWNEDPYSSHAQTPLGELKQDDSCWTNDTASVCAY